MKLPYSKIKLKVKCPHCGKAIKFHDEAKVGGWTCTKCGEETSWTVVNE